MIDILGLDYKEEQPIFIGNSNLAHIKQEHSEDFEKYGKDIENIIKNLTYLARNEKKKSIEFIKECKINNDFVLVAVRVSNLNIHFARTMYVMADEKVSEDGTGSRSPL